MSGSNSVELERWYPEWSRQLATAHASGSSQLFVLHGNVNDLIRVEKPDGVGYSMLPEFLATQLFGRWDSVLYYDQVRGPRAMASTKARLDQINQHLERFVGPVEQLRDVREVGKVFSLLDRYLELALLKGQEKPSVAVILDYAHLMAPSSSVSTTARELAPTLATLLNWAKSPYFKRAPFAFCLISERRTDLHDSLTQSGHTLSVELPFPDRDDRLRFLGWAAAGRDFGELCEVGIDQLADFTAGLTLVNLQGLMQRAVRTGQRLSLDDLKIHKKRMIEGECQGLVEFIEPSCGLDLVVGQGAAVTRLTEDAGLLRAGRLDAVPMGYLICGPVGTGKTFLAECYAGSVGIPCVKLLNFRSKYVGETEGNLEKVLKVLRVMGPVAVIIDEADAMLGDRKGGSDSGTSSRVFGQFAAQMGNTAYRGRIIWFLLTCRPDLLPIDLKRQGRCEVHIPLFYPETDDERREMFLVMGRKNRIDIAPEEVPAMKPGLELSGADIEGIANRARRLALLAGKDEVHREHLQAAMDNFIPSAQTEEKELQVLAAVIESTDVTFLPESLRAESVDPEGRAELMARFRSLRAALGE
jgi:AAA+ superfamily predicted ATPase